MTGDVVHTVGYLAFVCHIFSEFGTVLAGESPLPPNRFLPIVDQPVWQQTGRDMHSQIWESATSVLDPVSGKRIIGPKRKFIEIATGLNFKNEQGNWERTREEFRITPEGFAVAEFGPHKLIVGNNINSDTAVDFLTSDGVRIRNGPLAIGFYDPIDGRNIVLATIKDTAGVLTAPNEVTFPSAFDNIDASLRITYKRAGMSADPHFARSST